MKVWFKTSCSSQEVGIIITNNWYDMGLYEIFAIEKNKTFLVSKEEITQIIE